MIVAALLLPCSLDILDWVLGGDRLGFEFLSKRGAFAISIICTTDAPLRGA